MPIHHKGRVVQKSKLIKALFKRLVRKVILCKAILIEMDANIGLNAKRNVIMLTRRKRSTSLFSSNEKMLFQKPIQNRTIEERQTLLKIVADLKCFQMFPPKVRARVAPYLSYIRIESGRTLMREGNVPLYVYFLLQGEVLAHNTSEDIYSKKQIQEEKFIAGSGDMIGNTSFIHNSKRQFTFTATTDIDCLVIDGEIFKKYLLEHVKRAVEAKYSALNKLYILDKFESSQKLFVALFGKLKEYQAMETIYYKDQGDLNYVYFILSGQCMILQHLKTKKIFKGKNKKDYLLCQTKSTIQHQQNLNDISKRVIHLIKEMRRQSFFIASDRLSVPVSKFSISSLFSSEIEHFFIDVGTLSYGAMFGLGEPMEDRAIMARTNVQCLLLPRFWLFAKEQNPGNIWQRLLLSFKNLIINRETLFEYFKIDRNWKRFTKQYVFEQLDKTRNTANPTKIQDIPLICRIVEYNLHDDNIE